MGSNTKKHKKEKEISRKRRHHSRSRSPSEPLEKDRRHHRRHHRGDRKRERNERSDRKQTDYESEDSDCVEVPPAPIISSHSPPSSPQRTRHQNAAMENESTSVNKGESISIEETNKLRAKLGLKPLEVTSSAPAEDGKLKDDLGEFYHAPAKNLSKATKEKKIRDKLEERREKRALEKRLTTVKTLGESDGEDDAAAWVNRNRELEKQKAEASKRAKLLEEMDAVFGVGDLVAEDFETDKKRVYNARHLKGMRVEHDAEMFKEGRDIILTLKDQEVLNEDVDALVNVNLLDDERYNKSNENKKQKPNQYGYDAYDDSIEPENRTLLAKYDDVIDSDNKFGKNSFNIGDDLQRRNNELKSIKAKLSNKRLESLILPEHKLASEYFTPEELAFKKPKKKVRKIRQKPKMLKADDLLPLDEPNQNSSWLKELGTRRKRNQENQEQDILETDDISDANVDLADIKLEPEVDNELELALSKARKLKLRERPMIAPLEVKMEVKEEVPVDGSIVLNATAEFCRSLGEIPTYGLAGNRDEEPNDLMEYELNASPPHADISSAEGAWSKVSDTPEVAAPTAIATAPILEDEPNIGWGVGGALKLAISKGYLEKEDQNRPSSTRFAHLQAKNYSIEDKSYGGEDDKFGGRRERYAGPTTDFKEKDGFKPNVKLDYIDDDGHVLSAKEAFRYLSHKFHGKGPGKNKVEKRIKKNEQEGLMMKMSSTDTPLGTLGMLQAKQKETHSAFVVLSGKHAQGGTVISKNKR